MEIPAIVGQQYAYLLPIGFVIVCGVLVFVFGFKPPVEPPSFKQLGLSADDKKSLKKKKVKDKKSQSNGHATAVLDEPDSKKDHSTRALKQSNKNEPAKTKRSDEHEKVRDKRQDSQKSPSKQEKKPVKKSGKENAEVKAQKPAKSKDEKPTDYDEGQWETAISRKDKKNKKKDEVPGSPVSPGKATEKKVNKKKEQDKKQENETQSPKSSSKSPKNKEGKKKTNEKQVEVVLTPVAKGEGQDKQGTKKSSKKKTAADKGDENQPVMKENAGGKQSKTSAPAKKPAAPKSGNNKESEPLKDKKNLPEPQKGAASDEVGDTWKEATQKKNKKKVRKD